MVPDVVVSFVPFMNVDVNLDCFLRPTIDSSKDIGQDSHRNTLKLNGF